MKAPNFPLAKVVDFVENSIGEVTQVILLKANKSIVKRDISSVILLVKSEQPDQTISGHNEDLNLDENLILDVSSTPKRQTAVLSRQKTRSMLSMLQMFRVDFCT